ncbi:hypothetical protein FGB62_115g08 [Gracilaria domingensis]|nr:hypothetical protein FGB62_115g08 [Gracilaria domingensis]
MRRGQRVTGAPRCAAPAGDSLSCARRAPFISAARARAPPPPPPAHPLRPALRSRARPACLRSRAASTDATRNRPPFSFSFPPFPARFPTTCTVYNELAQRRQARARGRRGAARVRRRAVRAWRAAARAQARAPGAGRAARARAAGAAARRPRRGAALRRARGVPVGAGRAGRAGAGHAAAAARRRRRAAEHPGPQLVPAQHCGAHRRLPRARRGHDGAQRARARVLRGRQAAGAGQLCVRLRAPRGGVRAGALRGQLAVPRAAARVHQRAERRRRARRAHCRVVQHVQAQDARHAAAAGVCALRVARLSHPHCGVIKKNAKHTAAVRFCSFFCLHTRERCRGARSPQVPTVPFGTRLRAALRHLLRVERRRLLDLRLHLQQVAHAVEPPRVAPDHVHHVHQVRALALVAQRHLRALHPRPPRTALSQPVSQSVARSLARSLARPLAAVAHVPLR